MERYRTVSRGQRALLRRSKALAALVQVRNPVELAEDLKQLRRLQTAGATFTPYRPLEPGESVRITEGAFAGYTGVVVRGKANDRLIVSIRLVRQAVSVEFDREMLQSVR